MPDKPEPPDPRAGDDSALDQAVAILREGAEARAHALRERTPESRATDDRAELERELVVLEARLKRWEQKLHDEPPSPRKLEMIRMGRARAQSLANAIRKLAPAEK